MKVSRRIKKKLRISFTALYLTGASYFVSRLFFKKLGDFGEEPGMAERLLGPLHLVAALGFIFVMGIVWDHHIRPAIRIGKHRVTGWGLNAAIAALGLSGVTILYGTESMMKFAETWHPWVGLSLLPLLLYHVYARKG